MIKIKEAEAQAGRDWTQILVESFVRDILQTNTGRLVICSSNSIKMSDDNGASWQTVHTQGYSINYLLKDSNNILYAIGDNNSVPSRCFMCRSIDNGDTWSNVISSSSPLHRLSSVDMAFMTAEDLIMIDGYDTVNDKQCLIYAQSSASSEPDFHSNSSYDGQSYNLMYRLSNGFYLTAGHQTSKIFYTADGHSSTELTGTGFHGLIDCCQLSTGRVLFIKADNTIVYSDNISSLTQRSRSPFDFYGLTIHNTNAPSKFFRKLIVLKSGRVLALTDYEVWGSDDNGINWKHLHTFDNHNVASLSNVVLTNSEFMYLVRADGIFTSGPGTDHYAREKYLDQNGAQEIITQFQAYCNSLVGA